MGGCGEGRRSQARLSRPLLGKTCMSPYNHILFGAVPEARADSVPRPVINPARVDFGIAAAGGRVCGARGSISAAAPHCHMSVMGASERLRRLEDALGKPLFHRHRYGLALTDAGAAAARAAKTILDAVNELAQEVADVETSPPTARPNTGRSRSV